MTGSGKLIVLYDIPCNLPWKAWSPNTWKIRYTLSLKGLPFRTEWVEFPDIESTARKLGAEPTRKNPLDGTPLYTVPFIYDESTGKVLSDSIKIGLYLDATYQDTPKVFPTASDSWNLAMHRALEGAIRALFPPDFWAFTMAAAVVILNPASEAYYRPAREALLGKKLDELMIPEGSPSRTAIQANLRKILDTVRNWFPESEEHGLWMGDTPSFSDFILGGYILWIKSSLGETSEEWNIVTTHADGKWARYMDALDKMAKVV